MGQKVNPIGIRLKINRTWDSVWFAKKNNNGNLKGIYIKEKISDNEISLSVEKMKLSLENKEKAAHYKIEQAKNEAINQVKKVATKVALETVEKVLTENLDGKKQEEIMRDRLKYLESMKSQSYTLTERTVKTYYKSEILAVLIVNILLLMCLICICLFY